MISVYNIYIVFFSFSLDMITTGQVRAELGMCIYKSGSALGKVRCRGVLYLLPSLVMRFVGDDYKYNFLIVRYFVSDYAFRMLN